MEPLSRKRYACDLCNKAFSTKSRLTFHTSNIHLKSTDRSVCLVCEKRFSNVHNLKVHERSVHMGIKKETCSQCDQQFHSKRDLEAHKRKEHGGGKLSCPSCKQLFVYTFSCNVDLKDP